eukprot:3572278-Amphidinium_carterae.1
MVQLASGHVTVNVAEYGERGWRAPMAFEPLSQQPRAEPNGDRGSFCTNHNHLCQGGDGNSRDHLKVGVSTSTSGISRGCACDSTLHSRSLNTHRSFSGMGGATCAKVYEGGNSRGISMKDRTKVHEGSPTQDRTKVHEGSPGASPTKDITKNPEAVV